MFKYLKKYFVIMFFFLSCLFSSQGIQAKQHRFLGAEFVSSFSSSYLNIESSSIRVDDNASWTRSYALGCFFDYKFHPNIALRLDWFFLPEFLNSGMDALDSRFSRVELYEAGFLLKRYFQSNVLDSWFGAGISLQYVLIDDFNSYVIHFLLAFGFDYEIYEDVFLCPEIQSGLGMKLLSSNDDSLVIDLPTGSDLSTSGIVIFAKLGFAKSF